MRKSPSVSDLRAVFEAGPKPPTPRRSSSISKDRNDLPEALLKLLMKDTDEGLKGGTIPAEICGPVDIAISQPVLDAGAVAASRRKAPVRKGGIGTWGRARNNAAMDLSVDQNPHARNLINHQVPAETPEAKTPKCTDNEEQVDTSANDGWTRFGVKRRNSICRKGDNTSEQNVSAVPTSSGGASIATAAEEGIPSKDILSIKEVTTSVSASSSSSQNHTSVSSHPTPPPNEPKSPTTPCTQNVSPYRTRHIRILDTCRVKPHQFVYRPEPIATEVETQSPASVSNVPHRVTAGDDRAENDDGKAGNVRSMCAVWEGATQEADGVPNEDGVNQEEMDECNVSETTATDPPASPLTNINPTPENDRTDSADCPEEEVPVPDTNTNNDNSSH